MSKATLEFDLNDHDDVANHLRAISAMRLCLVIDDFDRWLRDKIKYEGQEHLQVVREAFNECLHDNAINMDELLQ